MSLLTDLYQKALGAIQNTFKEPELVSPLPKGYVPNLQAKEDQSFWDNADLQEANEAMAKYGGKPQVKNYRHQIYDDPSYVRDGSTGGLKFDELLAAARQANKAYPRVPVDLLMDKFAIESGGGQYLKQFNNGPGRGPSQFEMPLPEDLARIAPEDFNPMSATDSAMLSAQLINNNGLSRWGTPGGTWGSLDASRREPKDRLSTYYSPEELNQFLAKDYQF